MKIFAFFSEITSEKLAMTLFSEAPDIDKIFKYEHVKNILCR
jgi:hypothetical protein